MESGDSCRFVITPSTGYHIADVLVDGFSKGAIRSYAFSGVVADHTIRALFGVNLYSIASSVSGSGGRIDPNGTVWVRHGANQVYSFFPASGCSLQNVVVDGKSIGRPTTHIFRNVTSSHAISASFSRNVYTINATCGSNDTISPAGSVSVQAGNSVTFQITPSSGYAVDSVVVDGSNRGSKVSYTFSNVNANYSISATFKKVIIVISVTSPSGGTWKNKSSHAINWNAGPPPNGGSCTVWARDTGTGVSTQLMSVPANGNRNFSRPYTCKLTAGHSYRIVVTYGSFSGQSNFFTVQN